MCKSPRSRRPSETEYKLQIDLGSNTGEPVRVYPETLVRVQQESLTLDRLVARIPGRIQGSVERRETNTRRRSTPTPKSIAGSPKVGRVPSKHCSKGSNPLARSRVDGYRCIPDF